MKGLYEYGNLPEESSMKRLQSFKSFDHLIKPFNKIIKPVLQKVNQNAGKVETGNSVMMKNLY